MGSREVYRDDPASVGGEEEEVPRGDDLEMRSAVVDRPKEVR